MKSVNLLDQRGLILDLAVSQTFMDRTSGTIPISLRDVPWDKPGQTSGKAVEAQQILASPREARAFLRRSEGRLSHTTAVTCRNFKNGLNVRHVAGEET